MSTRFDQAKPSAQAFSAKRNVLNDFRALQKQLNSINQEVIVPNCDPLPGPHDFDQTEEVSYFYQANSFDVEFCKQRISENLTERVQHIKRLRDVHIDRN